jgi:cytochrome c553
MKFPIMILLALIAANPCWGETADPNGRDPVQAAIDLEQAIYRSADIDRGRQIYLLCAVCHEPEGWGAPNGAYPQIAGQIDSVVIKQLADIRARNRDVPTMFPFTLLTSLSIQDIADVSAYIAQLPMTPRNGKGPGTDLAHGKQLYGKYCADCHGENGEGIAQHHMPRIQGQHYSYLMRQFEWIRNGRRRNADKEMMEQIQMFTARDTAAIMDYVSRLRPPAQKVAALDWRNPDFPHFKRR